MYGLPQVRILTHKKLTNYLGKHGFKPTKHTPGLWTHHTAPITFSLVADDFGIKYMHKNIFKFHQHFKTGIQNHKGLVGHKIHRFDIRMELKRGYVDLSMPCYISRVLKRFAHPLISKNGDSPSNFIPPIYSKQAPQREKIDILPLLEQNIHHTHTKSCGNTTLLHQSS